MLITLIIGALAGWGAQRIETQVTDQLYRWLGADNMIADQDRGVASLVICLLGGALLLSLFGSGAHLFLFILAAGMGYFQEELREALLNRKP